MDAWPNFLLWDDESWEREGFWCAETLVVVWALLAGRGFIFLKRMGSGVWVFGLTVVGTCATIAYVHLSQKWELDRMKDGVRRDAVRLRFREEVLRRRREGEEGEGGSAKSAVAIAAGGGGDGKLGER